MQQIMELWLPILVSSVFVFLASCVLWMALPFHKNDYKDPGDKEDGLLAALKTAALPPGVYFVPWMQCDKSKQDAAKAKMEAGPWVWLTVMNGKPNFGKSLGLWFINILFVGVCVAYISRLALEPGAHYLKVFQISGAAAFLAYCGYLLPLVSWHAMPMKQLPTKLFDGLVYAGVTAGTFGWMWPDVVAAKPL